jgi:hypothetical protein
MSPHQAHQLRHLSLPADETRRLPGQVPRNRIQRSQRREPAAAELEHPHRAVQIPQAMLPQIDQHHISSDQPRGLGRHQHLPTMTDRHQPRRPVHRGAEIIPVTQLRLTGMQTHPHPDRLCRGPRLRPEKTLGGQRGSDGRRRRRESGRHPITHR